MSDESQAVVVPGVDSATADVIQSAIGFHNSRPVVHVPNLVHVFGKDVVLAVAKAMLANRKPGWLGLGAGASAVLTELEPDWTIGGE